MKKGDCEEMGEKEIKEEYQHLKRDVEKMADEKIKKLKKKINDLEEEAVKIGKETENILNNNKKFKTK
jgi:hypothetical protein